MRSEPMETTTGLPRWLAVAEDNALVIGLRRQTPTMATLRLLDRKDLRYSRRPAWLGAWRTLAQLKFLERTFGFSLLARARLSEWQAICGKQMSSSATAEKVSQHRGRSYTQQTPYRASPHLLGESPNIFQTVSLIFIFFQLGRWEREGNGAKKTIKGREECSCSPKRPDIGTIGEKTQGGSKVRVVTCCSHGIDFSLFAEEPLVWNFPRGATEFDYDGSTSGGSVACLLYLAAPLRRLLQAPCLHIIIWSNYGL